MAFLNQENKALFWLGLCIKPENKELEKNPDRYKMGPAEEMEVQIEILGTVRHAMHKIWTDRIEAGREIRKRRREDQKQMKKDEFEMIKAIMAIGKNIYISTIRSEKRARWKEKKNTLKDRGVKLPKYRTRKNTEYVSTEKEPISKAKKRRIRAKRLTEGGNRGKP